MSVDVKVDGIMVAAVLIAAAGVVILVNRKEIVETVGKAVDITSDQNLAYRGAEALGEATGGWHPSDLLCKVLGGCEPEGW